MAHHPCSLSFLHVASWLLVATSVLQLDLVTQAEHRQRDRRIHRKVDDRATVSNLP